MTAAASARAGDADAYVAVADAGSPQGWGWGASDEQTDHCKRLRDLCDCTPLDTDAVEALVREHEGAASEPNSSGETALHLLCKNPAVTLQAVGAVFSAWPPAAEAKTRFGSTALHLLCDNGRAPFEAIQLLLESNPGAATQVDDGGRTPLASLRERGAQKRQPPKSWAAPAPAPEAAPPPPRTAPAAPKTAPSGGRRSRPAPIDMAAVKASGAGLPRLRMMSARSPPRQPSAPFSPAHPHWSPRSVRGPRSLRSPRSLRRLRTSRTDISRVSSDADSARGVAPRRSLTFRVNQETKPTEQVDREESATAPPASVHFMREHVEVAGDRVYDVLREKSRSDKWVGLPVTKPERYSLASFVGFSSPGSNTLSHLKIDAAAHVRNLMRMSHEEQQQSDDEPQQQARQQQPSKARGKRLFQAAAHVASSVGVHQARYAAVRGPMLMGDGEPGGEHRSVVLVSKRDHHEGGDEDSAKPYSLMPRQFLKVFVVSKVIPQNTSLSKINATWLRHLFPTPSNKPVLGRTSSTRGSMGAVLGDWDTQEGIALPDQFHEEHFHRDWLEEFRRHELHTREQLVRLADEQWDMMKLPPAAKEVIRGSLEQDSLKPSEVYGLPQQMLRLEDARIGFQSVREAPHFGSLTVQLSEGLYPEHPAAGKLLRFSSLLLEEAQNAATAAAAKLKELQAKSAKSKNRFEFSDEDRAYAAAESALESAEEQIEEAMEAGAAQMRQWKDYLLQAQAANLALDTGLMGTVRPGAKYAVVSLPGEEFELRSKLWYATEEDFQRTFGPNEGSGLGERRSAAPSDCCVWTYKGGFNAVSGQWKANVQAAIADGQTLIVYSRRNWKNRVEPADLTVSASENESWPGIPIELKKGGAIAEYGTAQEREVAWLKKQDFWDEVLLKPVEELDVLRAELGGGVTYRGQWSLDGEPEGQGTKCWADGDVYKGEWQHGLEHGRGRKSYVARGNGDVYDGEWKHGLHDGEGTVTHFNGDSYQGGWLRGARVGKGSMRLTHENGDVYEGDSLNAKEHGKGALKCKNGNAFEGHWSKGQKSGEGTYTYANGDTLTGDFHGLRMVGEGDYTWKQAVKAGETRAMLRGEWRLESADHVLGRVEDKQSGDWYDGGWVVGKRKPGAGRMRKTFDEGDSLVPEGGVYEGDCLTDSFGNSQMHGEGRMEYANGDVYVGGWKRDQRCGFGDIRHAANPRTGRSDSFLGHWKDDVKHGRGDANEYDEEGMCRVYAAEWEHGKIVRGSARSRTKGGAPRGKAEERPQSPVAAERPASRPSLVADIFG